MCFILLNGSDGIESACSAGDLDLIPGSGRFSWRREWLPTPVFLPGESHRQRSLADYSPRGRKESDMTERLTLSLFPTPRKLQKGDLEMSCPLPRIRACNSKKRKTRVLSSEGHTCTGWSPCCQEIINKTNTLTEHIQYTSQCGPSDVADEAICFKSCNVSPLHLESKPRPSQCYAVFARKQNPILSEIICYSLSITDSAPWPPWSASNIPGYIPATKPLNWTFPLCRISPDTHRASAFSFKSLYKSHLLEDVPTLFDLQLWPVLIPS